MIHYFHIFMKAEILSHSVGNFFATQILREINFVKLQISKTVMFVIFIHMHSLWNYKWQKNSDISSLCVLFQNKSTLHSRSIYIRVGVSMNKCLVRENTHPSFSLVPLWPPRPLSIPICTYDNIAFPLLTSEPFSSIFPKTYLDIGKVGTVGVPTTSWILTGDCQMLSFSTLTKVPFLIFLIRQTPSTHKLCPASLLNKTEQASQAVLVRLGALSYLNNFNVLSTLYLISPLF